MGIDTFDVIRKRCPRNELLPAASFLAKISQVLCSSVIGYFQPYPRSRFPENRSSRPPPRESVSEVFRRMSAFYPLPPPPLPHAERSSYYARMQLHHREFERRQTLDDKGDLECFSIFVLTLRSRYGGFSYFLRCVHRLQSETKIHTNISNIYIGPVFVCSVLHRNW